MVIAGADAMILRRLPNTEVGNLRGFGRVEDPEMSGFPLVFAKVAKTPEDCQASKMAKGLAIFVGWLRWTTNRMNIPPFS
jgi:hypothetical protein